MSKVRTNRPIFLCGMPGAGKSTVGPIVATLLKRDFVDLDLEISRTAGRTISDIFESEGESGFRGREREALSEVIESDNDPVVALGGGTLVWDSSRRLARDNGTLVYLKASLGTLRSRLAGQTDRPLLNEGSLLGHLTTLARRRQVGFSDTDFTVPTDSLSPEEVADEIARHIQEDDLA